MRNALPVLFLASPAVALPANISHSHTEDWAAPAAMLLIGAAVLIAERKAVRVRRRQ